MNKTEAFRWQESLQQTYQEFTTQVIAFAPQLFGAILMLIMGWIMALILRIATNKLVHGFDSLFKRLASSGGIKQESIKRSYAEIASKLVFWMVMIFFIAAAANLLGWDMFSSWVNTVIAYLPNLIAGLLIILAGFIISNIARTGIANTSNTTGIKESDMLARVAQIIIFFTALVVGIEQIGINVRFLTNALLVVVGVLLGGGALAFSFGAKSLIENIIGAQYFRKHCRIGEQLKIGDIEGSIIEVTQTTIILDTGTGRTVIPAKKFQEQVSSFTTVVPGSSNSDSLASKRGADE